MLNLLPTVPLGGPATVANRDTRSMRSFTVPWIPHDDVITPQDIQGVRGFGVADAADPLATVMERKLTRMRAKHAQTREYMEINALRGIVKDGAGISLYDYFTEFGLAQQSVDFVLGTAGTNVQAKCREVLREIETELKGETMTGVLALVSPGFFDKLIGHAKVEEAYKYFSSTGAQPLREDTRRRFPFAGHRVRGIQRHRHALDRRDRDADPGERRHRVPARHDGHLRHLWRAGEPDRDRQHDGAADLRPPDRAAGRQRHRREDRGLAAAGEQAAAARGPHPHQQLIAAAGAYPMTAVSLEQIAVDASFAVWGKAATYVPPGGGAPIHCTVIRDLRDREMSGLNGRPFLQRMLIEVRSSEVPAPAKGGTFIVNGSSYSIESDPESDDPERLVWRCTVRP